METPRLKSKQLARTSDAPCDSCALQAAMGKRGRDRSPSSEEERGSRNTSKFSKYKKKDKGKRSSKRATRSVSRSRSPPARSRGKDSGRSRRNDRSRSPSLDDEARKRAKEERREQKYQEKLALKKAQRRAAESAKDKADRKMKAKQDGTAAHFGYTNDINPFGDSNLTEQFVWGKKKEKEGTADQLVTKREQRDAQKKNIEEIEKVRKRRDDAEAEREEMERLKAEESRLREQQQYGDWQKKEEHFHLKQATQRSKIRLVEGRDRPIDRLAKNVLLFGEQDAGEEDVGIKYGGKGEVDVTGLEMELREPYKLFDGLTLEELEELQAEIVQYQELVGENGPNRDFWLSLGMVCDDKVSKAKELLGETEEGVATGGLHKTVINDVTDKFENQTLEELSEQQTKIEEVLDSGNASVDSEFWEAVLKELHVFKAMAKLRNVHQTMLEAQLEKLEEMRDTMKSKNPGRGEGDEEEGDEEEGEGGKGPAAAMVAADSSALALGMLANEKSKGMGDQEEGMDLADEVDMGGKTYWWHDKYRPRKPRYFNRVKTGYDWNKYNQTHYDHDNPPPKTVQGYKFNVFYPDLIDRQETPKYHLEKADHPGFAILRFHAGPPYEDIAFKIINREWEFGRKRGFRCVFERGVLSLYFNFKSLWYRK
eukprot:jgi/Undpi1/1639/HiC_scaffold_11.g05029.m1